MSQVVLSHLLPVLGLVGHYPANYLIGRSPHGLSPVTSSAQADSTSELLRFL